MAFYVIYEFVGNILRKYKKRGVRFRYLVISQYVKYLNRFQFALLFGMAISLWSDYVKLPQCLIPRLVECS